MFYIFLWQINRIISGLLKRILTKSEMQLGTDSIDRMNNQNGTMKPLLMFLVQEL